MWPVFSQTLSVEFAVLIRDKLVCAIGWNLLKRFMEIQQKRFMDIQQNIFAYSRSSRKRPPREFALVSDPLRELRKLINNS